MAGGDHGERLAFAEAKLQHHEKSMDEFKDAISELVDISRKSSESLVLLTEQVLLARALQEQVNFLNGARENHETRLALAEHQLKELETLPDEVRRNSFIGKLVTAIGAASFSGLVAYVVGH